MSKEYTSLGLMSGTSGDGVDASIIRSDGEQTFELIKNDYFEYNNEIYNDIHYLKDKIINSKDLNKYEDELNNLEKKITLFHAQVTKKLNEKNDLDIIGFHGQTIYHNAAERISVQLGDGKLLSQLVNNNIVYNFRKKDIQCGGEGAPLAPVFHRLISKHYRLDLPIVILNIGGISNITIIDKSLNLSSKDIGPGNCLIDSWLRKNSKKKFDNKGHLASIGMVNEIILEQGQELYSNSPPKKTLSLDVNDFDISFARGLTLEDGTSTLTDLTSRIIGSNLTEEIKKSNKEIKKVLICGGGRKNITLIKKIKKHIPKDLIFETIDNHGIDGDFVESQAFAYIAIRSILDLPITFPETTGCDRPLSGGDIIKFK